MSDPIADKLTQTAMLGCLLTRFDTVWWLLGVLVAKETAMAVMGLLVIRRTGGVYSAAWHGKLHRPPTDSPHGRSTAIRLQESAECGRR